MAKILWIDDYAGRGTKQRIGFDALIYFVELNGHEVQIASTQHQILAFLEKNDCCDLLILDIIMDPLPSSSQDEHQYGGIDVLEVLAQGDSGIPIIILSVMPSRMIREEATRRGLDLGEIGVKEILRKGSVTPSQLAEVVESCLGKKIVQGRDAT